MSLLFADAGATKTSWTLMSGRMSRTIRTSGINPSIHNDSHLRKVILKELPAQFDTADFSKVIFYGAGCKADENAQRVRSVLQELVSGLHITVSTDLEGAGRALFGMREGIMIISGTGSSAGLMKQGKLTDMMPAGAWPKGDRGSGSHLGELILKDHSEGTLPAKLKQFIDKKLSSRPGKKALTKPLCSEIARLTAPMKDDSEELSQYFVEKAKTMAEALFVQVEDYFGERLKELPVKMIGSTAYYLSGAFTEIFENHEIKIEEINRDPVEGLIRFHTENL